MRDSKLGGWSATALVVGHTIGVGIFLTPAELIGALASPALTLGLWLIGGALVFAGAITFGALASAFPRSGGLYVYLNEAWGRRIAFLYGWQSLLIMDPGVIAALAIGLTRYVVVLWPAAAQKEKGIAVAMIWGLALLNMAGLRLSSLALNLMTAGKVLALIAVVAVALAFGAGSWSHFAPFATRRAGAPPIREALGLGLIGIFYSFGGFWEASRVAGEIRDPRRQLPRALALGVALVTALYVATTLAFLYLVPIEQTRDASTFARNAGEALLGRSGPAIFAAVVTLSVLASAAALVLMAPRVYLAMERDGLFPAALAALNRKTNAPVRATALLALLASVFVFVGSFQQIVAFFLCTTLGFVALAAAGIFSRRLAGVPELRLRCYGYPVTPVLFGLFVLGVVSAVAVARPLQALAGFAITLIGLPVYHFLGPRAAPDVSLSQGGPQ